ncbi:hypothetical protein ABIB75_007561 [Bradyrhizobium sp. GM2.2]
MAAPTNAANVMKALANSEPSTLALFGHGAMSDLSPLSALERTSADSSSLWVHALLKLPDDGLERQVRFFDWLETACGPVRNTSRM